MGSASQYEKFLMPVVAKGVEPLEIESAKGCTVRGADGKEYLDCFSGISVVNAGHGHPKVLAAARAQMEKLVHCCSYVYRVPAVGELAERLAEAAPGRLRKSFFSNSGAEALEGALRLAKKATGKREVVALGYSFHGRTFATLSITGNRARKTGGGPYMPGVAFGPPPYCYRCPLKLDPSNCGTACAHALADTLKQQTSGDVAAFVAEPILGEGGILVPPDEYFQIAVPIFHEEGALFICDEVQTGFGRTGKLFAIEHYGVSPDILTLAKGLANGFPLGAFIAREPVCDALQPGEHLSTFGGNPVAAAAAVANLEVLREERFVENAAARGGELLARLGRLKESSKLVGDVRGKGLMIGIELVKDKNSKEPAGAEAKALRARLREEGYLVGVGGPYGNVLRLQPPLCIDADQCDRVAGALEGALG
ncbi:MAG: aspartate aminotransferase family protein [Planctomycetota bacterium]|nr:aspartate aminotransferase family protein [Planctomycetota bacterium]